MQLWLLNFFLRIDFWLIYYTKIAVLFKQQIYKEAISLKLLMRVIYKMETRKIVLLGPPGSGKSTVAEGVASMFSLEDLYMGQVLREQVAKETIIGNIVKEYMLKGELVPEDFIFGLAYLLLSSKDNFLIDGFPRTLKQAEFIIGKGVSFNAVLFLDVSEEEVVRRLSNRRVCPGCKAQYHKLFLPPKVEDVCDKCESKLERRADDDPETIKNRFREYHSKTAPLIEFFTQKGLLYKINASLAPKEVLDETIVALKKVFSLEEEQKEE